MEKLTAMKNNMSKKTREKVAKAGLIVNTTAMMMVLNMTNVLAVNSNTDSIDQFIDFVCDWLMKIGGVVGLVGGVLFALGWQRDDAEGKSRGLMTLMAGFMLIAIAQAPDILVYKMYGRVKIFALSF